MDSAEPTSVDPSGLISFSIPEQWDDFLSHFERYAAVLGDIAELETSTPGVYPREEPGPDVSLREIFRFIRHKSTHVLIETPYFDADHQDEFAKHYAHTFQRQPGQCERIHIFAIDADREATADTALDLAVAELEAAALGRLERGGDSRLDNAVEQYVLSRERSLGPLGECLGFTVLRPSLNHPVGRTVLRPPEGLSERVSCQASFRARPGGWKYKISGFPFLSQDGQLSNCAHAAIWMMAYYHHELHGTRRVYLSDIATAAGLRPEETPGEIDAGMTFDQIASVFRTIGLPAIYHRADEDSPSTIRRYLNSRLPVLVVSRDHAMVLLGYGRDTQGHYWIAHNDLHGPYITVRSKPVPLLVEDSARLGTWDDNEVGRWEGIFIPRPSHTLYMKGHEAEVLGAEYFQRFAREPLNRNVEDFAPSGQKSFRTYTTQANDYKEQLRTRVPAEACALHIEQPMPKWVWVVELHDADKATYAPDCVIGELVLDATGDPETAGVLCANLPGLWFKQESRLGINNAYTRTIDNYPPYKSGIPLHSR